MPGRVSRVRFVFFLEEFDMRHAQDLAHDAHRERQRGNLANGKRISGSVLQNDPLTKFFAAPRVVFKRLQFYLKESRSGSRVRGVVY